MLAKNRIMASIEQELKTKNFFSEQTKANLNIMVTANWLNNKTTALLKPFNVTPEQFNVLRILKGQHPIKICQRDILERMIAKQSNITLIIKKLREKKLIDVQVSDEDKRHYVIALTDLAFPILSDIDLIFEKEMPKINQLSISEAYHLNSLLDKLRE